MQQHANDNGPRITLTERFEQALEYAVELHREQARKGSGTPYVAHLLGVTAFVLEDGGSEDEAIAGLLHDGPEDHGGAATLREIEKRFGPQVAEIVESCTDTMENPKPDWHTRKEQYLAHLGHTSPAARRVSLADKLYNARAILQDYRTHGAELWERFKGSQDDLLWYYTSLSETFARLQPGPMADELGRTVAELERLVCEAPTQGAVHGR